MKITKLETLYVKPRWLFLKVHTDEGIIGLGEPIVEGRAQTVDATVHEAGRYLIREDPRRIEHHWQAIYRGAFYRGGPVLCSALSDKMHDGSWETPPASSRRRLGGRLVIRRTRAWCYVCSPSENHENARHGGHD